MALFHLSVTQTKRSAGQSAIASAAYRSGEKLYSEYYGEYAAGAQLRQHQNQNQDQREFLLHGYLRGRVWAEQWQPFLQSSPGYAQSL